MILKKAIWLIIILSLMIGVNAQTEDFLAFVERTTVPLCECTVSEDILTVQNQNVGSSSQTFVIEGDLVSESTETVISPSTYTVTTSGQAGLWVSTAPQLFTLQQGESQAIQRVISAPCNAIGSYDLITSITTSQGVRKDIPQTIQIQECSNAGYQPLIVEHKGCPCSPTVFSFSLRNSAPFTEQYDVSIDHSLAAYISVGENPITLAPQESKIINLYLNAPCDVYGEYEIPMILTSLNTGEVIQTGFRAEYNRGCYDYEVQLGKAIPPSTADTTFEAFAGTYELCEKEQAIVPLLLKHTSNITNNYYIDLEGASWIGIDTESTVLQPNQQTVLRMLLSPPEGLSGEWEFPIEITTQLGDLKKLGVLSVSVESCFLPTLDDNQAAINYSGLLSSFTVRNKGTRAAVYNITVEGERWISVPQPILELEPEGKGKLAVQTVPLEDTEEGSYEAKLQFLAENGAVYERSVFFDLKAKTLSDMDILLRVGIVLIWFIVLFFILRPAKKVRRVVKKKRKPRKAFAWKPWLGYGLILLLAILLFGGLFAFKEKILPLLGAEGELEPAKPIVLGVEQGVEPTSDLGFMDSIASLFEPISSKIPYFWYIVIGLLVVIIFIVISEIKRRKKKDVLSETKEEPVEADMLPKPVKQPEPEPVQKIESKKEVPKVADFPESSEGIKNWKIYLLVIGILIIIAAGFLFWPTISKFIPVKNESVAAPVVEKVAEPVVREAVNYWQYALYGVIALAVIIFILEMIRRRKKKPIDYDIQEVVPEEEKPKEVKKEKKKELKKEAKKQAKKTAKKEEDSDGSSRWKVILVPLIILIILIGGILAYRTYVTNAAVQTEHEKEHEETAKEQVKEPVKEEKIEKEAPEVECTVSWDQDTSFSLNLADAFQDPDLDLLLFSSTTPESIDVNIAGGSAVLTPSEGFAGNRFIVFTAQDGKGGKASSGIITLCVNKVSWPGFSKFNTNLGKSIKSYNDRILSFMNSYVWYIVSGIVILVVLILLINYRKSILSFLEEEEKPVKRKKKSK
ncbi:MAG: hypothetical protein QF632_06560 [Candidatus Woesearchaeota archaeon]|jgi:TRAP-type C4-dicarboxylate transport system permease small subunit|nr:hypothetical protein [Candidatus Woesearchaeota archaeon]MDP7324397.1 hypothetical protein [Candidatus Woesearchaeota archaeon]